MTLAKRGHGLEPSGLVLEESRGSWQGEGGAADSTGVFCGADKAGLGDDANIPAVLKGLRILKLARIFPDVLGKLLGQQPAGQRDSGVLEPGTVPSPARVYPAGFGISSLAGPSHRAVFPKVRLALWALRRRAATLLASPGPTPF